MRSCALSLILFALMIVGFVLGALSGQTALLMISVFASPVVWFIGGWSAKGVFSGRRLTFVAVERSEGESSRPARRTAQETL